MASNKQAGFMKDVKSLAELVKDFDEAALTYGYEDGSGQSKIAYDEAKAKLLQRIKNVEKLIKQLKESNRSLNAKVRNGH